MDTLMTLAVIEVFVAGISVGIAICSIVAIAIVAISMWRDRK